MAQLTSRAAVVVFEYIRLERRNVDAAFESMRVYAKHFLNTLHANKKVARAAAWSSSRLPAAALRVGPDNQVDATLNQTSTSSKPDRLNDLRARRSPPPLHDKPHLAERTAIARALETIVIWISNEKPAAKPSLAQKQCTS